MHRIQKRLGRKSLCRAIGEAVKKNLSLERVVAIHEHVED